MKEIRITEISPKELKILIQDAVKSEIKKLKIESAPETKLLTRTDTAKFLKISLPTLHQWTKIGIVKAYRIGNRVLYKEIDVLESLMPIRTQINKPNRNRY